MRSPSGVVLRPAQAGLATSCSRAPSASVSVGFAQLVDHEQRMRPDVALGMVERRLRDAFHREQLGHDGGEQARRVQQLEAALGGALAEDEADLLADALPGDAVDVGGLAPDDVPGGGVDREVEARGEAHRAQHAELVLVEAGRGIADRAHDAAREIVAAADVVDDAVLDRVEEHAVDGEIPARRVLLGVAERDRHGMARVEVDAVAAEGRDLDAIVARRHRARRRTARRPAGCPRRAPARASAGALVATS